MTRSARSATCIFAARSPLSDREMVGATLIRLGRDPVLDGFWSRTLHIIERPGGPSLRSDPPSGAGPGACFAHRFEPELGRCQPRGG